MRRCEKCNVEILDETAVCPLCKNVLKETDEAGGNAVGYPDVKQTSRKLNFVIRLYCLIAIIAEAVLVIINYLTYDGLWWSAIAGISILYCYITLKYSIQKNAGYRNVMWIQVIGAVLLGVGVDNIVGYRGWSANYVFPGAILLLDGTIMVLMLVNMVNWQSYLLMQICTVAASMAGLVMSYFHIITKPLVTIIAAAVSVCLLLATIMLGDRRAKAELKRRFHV